MRNYLDQSLCGVVPMHVADFGSQDGVGKRFAILRGRWDDGQTWEIAFFRVYMA